MRLGALGSLVVVAGLLAAPAAVDAQGAARVYQIGVLAPGSAQGMASDAAALRQALRELGHVDGQGARFEWRFAEGNGERLAAGAAELVRLKLDVIVAINTPAATAAKGATTTVPIVFVRSADPVASGLVTSLARPGGNLTGVASFVTEMGAKRLELLKAAIPRLTQVAVLWNAPSKPAGLVFGELKSAGPGLGVQIQDVGVRGPQDLRGAVEAASKARARALVVIDDLVIASYQAQILDLAARHRLAVASMYREFADAGGLMAYGPSLTDTYQRAGAQIDKILKGAKPGDLPVQHPAKFDFVLNLKTAKALGLTIPHALLVRANEVIE